MMMICLDTGDPAEIRQVKVWGFPIDKITSNPTSLSETMRRRGGSVYDIVMQLRDEASGVPISVEALGTSDYGEPAADHFIREAEIINGWGKDFVVKLPAVQQGFAAAAEIDFAPINFTLVFSQHQGYLTGDYGGAYTSPFVGRYDDKLAARGMPGSGMDLVDEIVRNFRSFGFSTKILTASVRGTQHIKAAADIGSHAITIPFGVFRTLHEQNKLNWLKALRDDAKPFEPQKPRRPTFSGAFDEEKMKDYERELLNEGMKKFMDDARRVRYSI